MNVAPITRFFKDVAKSAVLRMTQELEQKHGKVIYKDYISIVHKYLIPFFGKYTIDSIDYKLLEQSGDRRAKRVLDSLRHTYATLALTHGNVPIHTLAKQMGTSVGMIERHYSHLDVVKAVHQLHGAESRHLIESTVLVDEKCAYKPKARKKRKG